MRHYATRARKTVFGLVVLGVAATSCGSRHHEGVSELTISRAWARPTPSESTVAAVYMTVESPVDDEILRVETPIAANASLHTSSSDNGGGHEGHGHGGPTANMVGSYGRLTKGVPLVMAPGGTHIMLEDLSAPLMTGDKFDLTLEFAVAGRRSVGVRVAANPPGD